MSYEYLYTLTTDANGNGSIIFLPHVGTAAPNSTAATVTGSNAAYTTLGAAPFGALAGSTSYRIVSAGIRIKRISAPLTSSGMVFVRVFPSEDGSGYTNVPFSGTTATARADIPLQDCSDYTVVFPHTSQNPQVFYPIDSFANVADWEARGFGAVNVAIQGGPATTAAFIITYVMHVEFSFADDATLALVATPSPPANPMVTAAAARVSSTATNLLAKGASAVSTMIERAASAALRGMMARYLGPASLALTVD